MSALAIASEAVVYNVECRACGNIHQPRPKSPLWWQAKKHSEKGFLDAIRISGKECGCVEKPHLPDAPFRVLGFDWEGGAYDIPCLTFVEAVKLYIEYKYDTVFITGVSERVKNKLSFM